MQKFGIFGGTFNPIHNGHLIIAELAREYLRLDRIIFIPSVRPPHKAPETIILFEHRAAMVRAAIAGNDRFIFSDMEETQNLSFTTDTLAKLKEQFPETEFYLIIGSDSLLALNSWKTPDVLAQQATLTVFPRVNYNARRADKNFLERAVLLPMPVVEISSSWVRERIKKNQTIRYLVPADVESYIIKNKLYV